MQSVAREANKKSPKVIYHKRVKELAQPINLRIEGDAGKIHFSYKNSQGKYKYVLKNADAKMLSTEVAGGFVGTLLGIHARAE